LKNDTNNLWRAVSAAMLRRWAAEPQVKQALLASVTDPDPQVRSRSLRALEPFVTSDEPVLAAFQAGLKDSSRSVRIDAAWGLRRQLETNSPAGRDLLHHLALNGDQPSGALQQGVFHLDRGNLDLAMAYFQKAVSWDTNSAPLHHALALGLSMQGKTESAVESLRTACRLAPSDAEYRFKLGLALSESGRPAEALEALEQTVVLDPQFAQAWYNLGLAYNAAGLVEKALASLTRAETIDPGTARFPYARATILARLQRIDEARIAARRALEINPGDPAAQELLDHINANPARSR
jgi:tetratricopeptide (TPR) repeat protein